MSDPLKPWRIAVYAIVRDSAGRLLLLRRSPAGAVRSGDESGTGEGSERSREGGATRSSHLFYFRSESACNDFFEPVREKLRRSSYISPPRNKPPSIGSVDCVA